MSVASCKATYRTLVVATSGSAALLQEGVDDDVEHEGQGSSSGSSSAEEGGGQQQQADFVEHAPGALSVADLQLLAHGWTAFIVGIVRPAD